MLFVNLHYTSVLGLYCLLFLLEESPVLDRLGGMRNVLFSFSKSLTEDTFINVEEWFTFPLTATVDQYYRLLIHVHNVPPALHACFRSHFVAFVDKENSIDSQKSYDEAIKCLTATDINQICSYYDSAYGKHVVGYLRPLAVSAEDIFAQSFNNVIHSHFADDVINLERRFALFVKSEIDKRNDVLSHMENELIQCTELGLQKHGSEVPEEITEMQRDYYHSMELVESQWNSCISELKLQQSREFRGFVLSCQEQLSGIQSTECINNAKPALAPVYESMNENKLDKNKVGELASLPWSETFTVQLGRQLRTMCNFRLTRVDLNEFLSYSGSCNNQSVDDLAERMSNSLNLYSHDLNGLVLLVSKKLNSMLGMKKSLAEACERSTEFHFPELGQQLEYIQETLNLVGSERILMDEPGNDILRPPPADANRLPYCELALGDVYITRHSNLITPDGGIHVVFHLVLDDEIEDTVRAPSPVHCALSAILRVCFDYNITTLSLPLLLITNLQENMNRTWRAKRVETVLKAIKGALMELITWRGPTLRSIHFLAPSSLNEDELNSFAHIISTSFLQPNPLIGRLN